MAILISSEFHSDPRVKRARQQIMLAMSEYQKKIKRVVPPNPNLKIPYEQMVEDFGRLRVGPLFLPYVGTGFGNGPLVELADGSIKYDMITGIGVHFFGHSHPSMIQAAMDAALGDTLMQGNLQQNTESFTFSKRILELANKIDAGLTRCFLTSSGAMANENALKLILHRKFPRKRMLAFKHCFMGRTLALSAITDKPAYRENLPVWPEVDYIPFFDLQDPEGSTRSAMETLKRHLAEHPGEYALMAFELIQGEAGSYPGNKEFFQGIMQLLKEQDIAVLVDEIQTFGRTHELFAYQLFNLEPYLDVVTIGKMCQVCATLFREEFKPPLSLISQTFTGSTASIMAGSALLEILTTQGYLGLTGKINTLGNRFREQIRDIAERYPGTISGPYGLGAMVAFTVFAGDTEKNKQFINDLFEAGVIAFLAGSDPVRVRFLPPIGALEDHHIEEVCLILESTLQKMING